MGRRGAQLGMHIRYSPSVHWGGKLAIRHTSEEILPMVACKYCLISATSSTAPEDFYGVKRGAYYKSRSKAPDSGLEGGRLVFHLQVICVVMSHYSAFPTKKNATLRPLGASRRIARPVGISRICILRQMRLNPPNHMSRNRLARPVSPPPQLKCWRLKPNRGRSKRLPDGSLCVLIFSIDFLQIRKRCISP